MARAASAENEQLSRQADEMSKEAASRGDPRGRRRRRRRLSVEAKGARNVLGHFEAPRAAAEKAARDAADKVASLESPLRLSVEPQSLEAARGVLARYTASYTLRSSANKATFLIANPIGLSGDEHPFAAALHADLLAAGVRVYRLSSAVARRARGRAPPAYRCASRAPPPARASQPRPRCGPALEADGRGRATRRRPRATPGAR